MWRNRANMPWLGVTLDSALGTVLTSHTGVAASY